MVAWPHPDSAPKRSVTSTILVGSIFASLTERLVEDTSPTLGVFLLGDQPVSSELVQVLQALFDGCVTVGRCPRRGYRERGWGRGRRANGAGWNRCSTPLLQRDD